MSKFAAHISVTEGLLQSEVYDEGFNYARIDHLGTSGSQRARRQVRDRQRLAKSACSGDGLDRQEDTQLEEPQMILRRLLALQETYVNRDEGQGILAGCRYVAFPRWRLEVTKSTMQFITTQSMGSKFEVSAIAVCCYNNFIE